jgi:hypothetical protein
MNLDTRKYVIIAFFLIVGVIYATRLFYMQVIDDSWTLRAQQIAEKRREITPPRGVVFDRDGRKIVSNSTYYNLMMIEKNIKNFDTLKFAKLIGWTPEMVRERFKEIVEGEGMYFNRHTGKKQSNYQKIRPYPFLKELTLEEVANIAPHLENFPGFYEEVTSMRRYPYANGANILGYLSEVIGKKLIKMPFILPGIILVALELNVFMKNNCVVKKGSNISLPQHSIMPLNHTATENMTPWRFKDQHLNWESILFFRRMGKNYCKTNAVVLLRLNHLRGKFLLWYQLQLMTPIY